MKKYFTLLGLILFSTLLMAQAEARKKSEDKEKILEVLEKYIVANETQNIKLMEEIWAVNEDIEAFGTAAGERLRGWDAIRKVFIHQFNTFTDTYISARDQIVHVDDSGNVAWFSQIINYNYLLEGVQKKNEGIRYTGVLKKIDGKWKLVQIHLSLPH